MITACRSCQSKNLEDILSVDAPFLSEFRDDDNKPAGYLLRLVLCNDCKLLQLKHTTPQSKLYTENYGYKSGISGVIRENLKEIVEEAKNYTWVGAGATVIDIGSNDGTLLSNYSKDVCRIAVEPIAKFAKESKQHADIVINSFFNKESCQKLPKADVITSISMFYDLNNPNEFIENIKSSLADDGIWIVQQNYLVGMLTNNALDNVVHEHLTYFSMLSFKPLLERHGLEIFEVKLSDINGGSFRTLIARQGQRVVQPSVEVLEKTESWLSLNDKRTYITWGERVLGIMKELHDFVAEEVGRGKKIYLLAASTRGNTLLQAAHLDSKLITAASERNPEKFGKIIASVGIPIISEEDARAARPDYFLVLPWFFKKEIIKREKEFLDSGRKLIFPLPFLEIVEGGE